MTVAWSPLRLPFIRRRRACLPVLLFTAFARSVLQAQGLFSPLRQAIASPGAARRAGRRSPRMASPTSGCGYLAVMPRTPRQKAAGVPNRHSVAPSLPYPVSQARGQVSPAEPDQASGRFPDTWRDFSLMCLMCAG